MTELSGFWTTEDSSPAGDQVAGYTQTQLSLAMQIIAACSGKEGVAREYDDELEVSADGANTVAVGAGAGVVDGKWYNNSEEESINIPSAVGMGNTRIDRIVLRASWGTTFTVRLTRIAGTDAGSPTAPAITQTSGTTYDVMLAQVLVNTSGTVTVTDERKYADLPEPFIWRALNFDTDLTAEDGLDYMFIPAYLHKKKIVSVHAGVHTKSTSGTPTIQLHNVTQALDILTTPVTVDANENTSYTAATQPVVNTSNNQVNKGDQLRVDCDVAGTGTKGLDLIIVFEDD